MPMDISLALKRFQSLQNTTKKSDYLWKPANGNHIVRIVPYKFNKDNPFIELYFHYNINNKTYLSPVSFGRPDPIVEFAEKLKRTGDTDDWKAGKKMEPKLRTFVPVIVRGKESEGVKFWGFGKTVYQEILAYIADPDYGDITDPMNGRDIALTVSPGEETGKSFHTTTIRIKPSVSKLSSDPAQVKELLESQKEITELYQELSYAELKTVLENWLNPTNTSSEESDELTEELEAPKPAPKAAVASSDGLPWDDFEAPASAPKPAPKSAPKPASKPAPKPSAKDDVASAFDDLFNS